MKPIQEYLGVVTELPYNNIAAIQCKHVYVPAFYLATLVECYNMTFNQYCYDRLSADQVIAGGHICIGFPLYIRWFVVSIVKVCRSLTLSPPWRLSTYAA